MPLYGLLFAALLSGFVLGAVFAWNGQRKWRRAARQRGAEAHELRRETERLTRQVRVMERARNAAAPPVRGYGQQGLIH